MGFSCGAISVFAGKDTYCKYFLDSLLRCQKIEDPPPQIQILDQMMVLVQRSPKKNLERKNLVQAPSHVKMIVERLTLKRNKRVTVREFKGKVYIDIREFYEKDGKVLP